MTGAVDHDLLITAGRVFCAETGLDGRGMVAVRGGRIAAAGSAVEGSAAKTLDYPDALLLPGLVDMHAHPARGGSRYGVDPDEHFLPRGVTTCMSQGDAGALDWPAYRDEVIGGCRTRVRLALHLSRHGESRGAHCFEHLEDADVDLCSAAAAGGGDEIWGIAFNTMRSPVISHDPREIMRRGIEAAEGCGLPILYGPRFQRDFPLEEQLPWLRAGDLVTYTFCFLEDNIIAGGRVRPEVREARDRGVLFDGYHGMQSFSFEHAEAAMAEGFYPDTVSTDQYNRHLGSDPPPLPAADDVEVPRRRHARDRGPGARHGAAGGAARPEGGGRHVGRRCLRRSGTAEVERGGTVAGLPGRGTRRWLLGAAGHVPGGTVGAAGPRWGIEKSPGGTPRALDGGRCWN